MNLTSLLNLAFCGFCPPFVMQNIVDSRWFLISHISTPIGGQSTYFKSILNYRISASKVPNKKCLLGYFKQQFHSFFVEDIFQCVFDTSRITVRFNSQLVMMDVLRVGISVCSNTIYPAG